MNSKTKKKIEGNPGCHKKPNYYCIFTQTPKSLQTLQDLMRFLFNPL
jgi:hypothetical protein